MNLQIQSIIFEAKNGARVLIGTIGLTTYICLSFKMFTVEEDEIEAAAEQVNLAKMGLLAKGLKMGEGEYTIVTPNDTFLAVPFESVLDEEQAEGDKCIH